MERSRLEPLGVPEAEYALDEAASRHGPSALDRWLLNQIVTKLGPDSTVRLSLWDERDVAPRDGVTRMRILDRKALWQLIVRPDLHFGDLYSAGRIEVRGDLLTLLLEVYRPRVKGRETRLLYHSRVMSLISQPESLFTTAAHALDYQFGFKVSDTWFFQFLQRAFAWIVLAQFALLVCSTSFVPSLPRSKGTPTNILSRISPTER